MAALDQEALFQNLKKRRVCRFCLSQDQAKLSNIYMRDTRVKTSAPLPIQVMAIASIEVFSADGMPNFVCTDCTAVFEYSYQFKQMCKKADNLLRQYPLTGKWPRALEKPVIAQEHKLLTSPAPQNTSNNQNNLPEPARLPTVNRVILNSIPSSDPVRPQSIKPKSEKINQDYDATSLLSKIENNDELSMDDIQQLVAAEDREDEEYENPVELPLVVVDGGNKTKIKLLNKSSVRILNKDVDCEREPRMSLPKITHSQDGNMEIVAEILDDNAPFETEPDPKNAEVIDTNIFPCPHCERTFPLMQLRDIHIKNHTRDRRFQCDECEKSFFSKYDLQRHAFTHNGARPFQCTACDRAFSRASLLQRHEKTHTDIPKYICVTCERPFLSKETMEKHAERHKINRPFQCKICNKGFAFKQGLERHEVIHSRQQPFSCQYCEQSFSTSMKLARHLTAHAGERPYPCKFCKKSYLLSHHLTRHLRSHKNASGSSSSVPFICTLCNKSFANCDELINHSTTHANGETLSCPLCKESYGNYTHLTNHIKQHTDGDAFACEFCDLIFMTEEQLQLHTDSEHAQEMEAYLEDDRVQAERLRNNNQEDYGKSDDSLQTTMDEVLDEGSSDNRVVAMSVERVIKQERCSPKIISQIVVSPAPNDSSDENNLLIPLKKIKCEKDDGMVEPRTSFLKTPQVSSPQPRRKVSKTPAGNSSARNKNQPTIQSMLKMPKGVTVKKGGKSATEKSPKEKDTPAPTTVSPGSNQNFVDMKIGDKNMKVQKIRITKSQAAAMAKEGRIQVKDGRIILTQDHI